MNQVNKKAYENPCAELIRILPDDVLTLSAGFDGAEDDIFLN